MCNSIKFKDCIQRCERDNVMSSRCRFNKSTDAIKNPPSILVL